MDTQLIQQEIETLKQYLQEPNLSNTEKELFQQRIDQYQLMLGTPQSENMLETAINQFAQVMQTDAGLSEDEVIQISERVFATSQISMSQLSPEVIDAIDKTKQITININTTSATASTSRATKTSGGQRRLFYVILSDVAANNNVYLYGPAGTGKTQMAKIVADALNYRVYVINCNQYTSPIEIVGGQTIDGYQEGKLIDAWKSDPKQMGVNPRTNEPYEGALLLIDELPKLDPNTAGIMNDALSTLKDPPRLNPQGIPIPKTIMNGRNQEVALGNLFVIATGNTLLLRPDPTYTANFAQDASLQDRFAGSTYKVGYDRQLEYTRIFENNSVVLTTYANGQKTDTRVDNINMAFLFNFLIDLRESIISNNYAQEAFVSMRIMTNLRDTYLEWRKNDVLPKEMQNPRPKTLQDGIQSFLSLFTPTQLANIMPTEIEEFLTNVIPDVNERNIQTLSTQDEIDRAKELVKEYIDNEADKIL